MDQDAFRKLVASTSSSSSSHLVGKSGSSSRGSILPSRTSKKAETTKGESTKTEFKPRKVHNKGKDAPGYRDRAAERRQGVAGDFAHVEALLEDFEKQHAEDEDKQAVEEKRRYLGGDLEHTVLVKGLDYALLEQLRAREAAKSSVVDEESLEDAFRRRAHASVSENNDTNVKGKKRTREDIIRELKEKRAKGGHDEEAVVGGEKGVGIEEAKNEGKFRPIGFKPIGGGDKRKTKDSDGVKKKKRKINADVGKEDARPAPTPNTTGQAETDQSKSSSKLPISKSQQPEPEPIEEVDIFADAGEYEGLKLDDDDEEGGEEGEVKVDEGPSSKGADERRALSEAPPRKWFDDEEEGDEMVVDDSTTLAEAPHASNKNQDNDKQPAKVHAAQEDSDTKHLSERDREIPEPITRLAPLQSSSVPSIRDILAADEALEAQEKRKARKEKRNAGGLGDDEEGEGRKKKKVSAETKLNREYKKLQAYTEKKKGQQ